MTTKIEWTDEVWNPVTGCTKVSQGCKNCYAERIAERFWGERKFTDVICYEDRLGIPLKWRKPRRVFVNSMSDLFHPDAPDDFISRVYIRMLETSWHTYQVLTKRPERMFKWMQDHNVTKGSSAIWLGVSVEDQKTADERIPWLLKTPAAVRFVSYEPALSEIHIEKWLEKEDGEQWIGPRLDWVIAGCESGPGARPAHPGWFRSVRDQCQAAGVPFFLKQMKINGKMVKMPELDGKVWNEYPEVK